VQAKNRHGDFKHAAVVFQDALTADAALRVFADWMKVVRFDGAATVNRRKAVHVAGGKGDDATAVKTASNVSRKEAVHGPRQRFLSRGAELHAGHEHDIG